MPLHMLVKVDFGHRENMGLFDTKAKAMALQTSLELELLESSSLVGISFYIEEWYAQ